MSVALIEVAPSMTWLLVSTSPLEVSTIPVPAALACWYPSVDTMSTRPGDTFEVICAVVSVLEPNASATPRPAKASVPAATTDTPASTARCRHQGWLPPP